MRRALYLLAVALAAAAAPPKTTEAQIRVPVWLEDGAAPEKFQATVEGENAPVLAVNGPQDDLVVLLVLDLTGDLTLDEAAKQALAGELEKLPPKTYVSVMRAQDGLRVLLDPTTDRKRAAEAIQSYPASGKAGLLDTLELTGHIADSMLKKAAVRVAVLYVTDSDVANYREDFTNPVINSSDSHDLSRRFPEALVQEKISKLDSALSAQQTPLFVVHLRYRSDRLNEAYQNGLKQLAETTSGASVFCRSTAEVEEAIRKTLASIASHYSLRIGLPAGHRARTVQIEVASGNGAAVLGYRTRMALREK